VSNEAENPEPQPDIKEAENPEPQPDIKEATKIYRRINLL